MTGMMSLLADNNLYQVMREIDWLPQLYEAFLVSNERTVVSLPLRNFSRSISFNLLSNTSEFYCALLRNGISSRKCYLCLEYHCLNHLCLPDMFETEAIDVLFDMFELKRSYLSFEDDLVSVIKLCGYLLIKPTIVHAFLFNLLSLREVRRSPKNVVFVYELYWNGFLDSAWYFSQGVDHPCFYDLLQQNDSYHIVKRKVRRCRYKRFRHLAPSYPYSYPLAMINFSRVRTGSFWYHHYAPPIDFAIDEYPEREWLSYLT